MKHEIHSRHAPVRTIIDHRWIVESFHKPRRGRWHWLWATIIALAVCGAAVAAVSLLHGCQAPCDPVLGCPVDEPNHRQPGDRYSGHLLGLLGEPELERADLRSEEYR
jgi:hypothetical protein